MDPNQLLEILARAAKLKTVTRHCETAEGRKESVADHSWRMALMALLLSENAEFQDVDMNRVIRMCLIHDLGEAFTGDIPTFLKEEADAAKEDQLFMDWIDTFPLQSRREWKSLLTELLAMETKEAKLYKAIDKLEAVISHNESALSTWLPLEYELQFQYGKENVQFSPYLTEFREAIDEVTRRKIEGGE